MTASEIKSQLQFNIRFIGKKAHMDDAVGEIKVRKQKIPENITYTKNKGNDFQNTATSSGPKTGDESDLRWIFAMAAAAFSGILLLYRKKKH